jgi:phosphoribosyl-AMP cyclohydrolase
VTAADLAETDRFQPRFDASGLIVAVVTDARDGALLMVAHLNEEALRLTLATGEAHFWSRSRGKLWRKGETSGEVFEVREVLADCDQDAIQLRVIPRGRGAACHTGRRTCFYRRIAGGRLETTGAEPLFDPKAVYGS